ncbi:MAG TPA: DUF2383 domain-containing protein [Thermoanaerobaculia bacterium]|nr:DUF2383 domain-containing protein [Thermoanaerobaculia bacterium]
MADTMTGTAVEQMNSLLRGEISAAETYRIAIDKVEGDRATELASLREISREHGEHAQKLREEIRRMGGEADDSSGAWGAWAKTVQGVSSLFGDASALKALKEGEEHGLKDYQDALEDVDASCRQLIAETMVPAQQRHIDILDAMIDRA